MLTCLSVAFPLFVLIILHLPLRVHLYLHRHHPLGERFPTSFPSIVSSLSLPSYVSVADSPSPKPDPLDKLFPTSLPSLSPSLPSGVLTSDLTSQPVPVYLDYLSSLPDPLDELFPTSLPSLSPSLPSVLRLCPNSLTLTVTPPRFFLLDWFFLKPPLYFFLPVFLKPPQSQNTSSW